jgi:hypothetical protein
MISGSTIHWNLMPSSALGSKDSGNPTYESLWNSGEFKIMVGKQQ